MRDDRASISIRMPRWLLDKLKEAGQANSNSMNAEIVRRVTASFEEKTVPWQDNPEDEYYKKIPIDAAWKRLNFLERELDQLYDAFTKGNSSVKPIILKRMVELEREYGPLLGYLREIES